MKKLFMFMLTFTFLALTALGCSNSDETTGTEEGEAEAEKPTQNEESLDPVTLKIMLPGDRPRDFDEVLAEAEARMADSLNVKLDVTFIPFSDFGQRSQVTLASGGEMDLIFDAPWMHLGQMAAQGYYEPLDDLLKEHGQDILAKRPQEMWEANRINGETIAVPLGNAYLSGRVYYVRKDIREKLGVDPITSYEELIDFAYKVKESGENITPIMTDKRGMTWGQYRKVFDYEKNILDTDLGATGVLFYKNNDGKVHNMFEEMDDTYWSWIEDVRQLYVDGLIHPDVLSVQDAGAEFRSGKAAILNTNDFGVKDRDKLAVESFGGEVEAVTFFSFEPGDNISDFKMWNFLALAGVSKNKERAIQFLNWTQQKENYDLLAYGIEGKHWEAVGDDSYKPLEAEGYSYFPYAWIWNPEDERFNTEVEPEVKDQILFTRDATNFTRHALTGFTFNQEPVANEIAQLNTITGKYLEPISNGVVDPQEYWDKYKAEAQGVVKTIQEEMQNQIDAFLANQ